MIEIYNRNTQWVIPYRIFDDSNGANRHQNSISAIDDRGGRYGIGCYGSEFDRINKRGEMSYISYNIRFNILSFLDSTGVIFLFYNILLKYYL